MSDAGLAHLSALKNLTRLEVPGTKVTPAGVAKLKAALPNCQIEQQESEPASKAPARASEVGLPAKSVFVRDRNCPRDASWCGP